MNNKLNQASFEKALLTGLFAGIVATLICFIFEIAYRYNTGYTPSEFINVSTITFIVNLILMIVGIIYYYFKKLFKKGELIYIAMFVLLTVFCIWKAEAFRRFADYRLSLEFSHLLSGTLLIIGGCTILIPILFHNKMFNEYVV